MKLNLSFFFAALLFNSNRVFGEDEDDGDGECSIDDYECANLTHTVTDYSKIYQDIWDADQNENGVLGIVASTLKRTDDDRRLKQSGYVIVNEPSRSEWDGDKDHKIFPEVVLPESKRSTYDLAVALFSMYTLDQSKPERTKTEKETAKIAAFVTAIQDTEPMKLAKKFVEAETNVPMTDEEWYELIWKIWFEIYDYRPGKTPNRSGFEHVFVGEQNRDGLGGYHFWYKYYLDDKVSIGYANEKDNMLFNGVRYFDRENEGVSNPDSVTLSHIWYAIDYETDDLRTTRLFKPVGGGFIGCSPEGMIALGLVAFYDPRRTKSAVINNAKYEMVLIKAGPNRAHINTFYNKFGGFTTIPTTMEENKDSAESTVSTNGDVRIIAAVLVNPGDGNVDDADDQTQMVKETITLINVSNASIGIQGWTVMGKNGGNAFRFVEEGIKLDAGEVRTFRVPMANVPLTTNEFTQLSLSDADGNIVHVANYGKQDSPIKTGYTILF